MTTHQERLLHPGCEPATGDILHKVCVFFFLFVILKQPEHSKTCSYYHFLFLSHLHSSLQLSAAVCQDAQSQVQGFPGAIRMPEQVQQRPETALGSESGDASLVPLDVLRPDCNQSSPLTDPGPPVQLPAAAAPCVCLAMAMMLGRGSRLGEVSQAPGQRSLW